MRFKNRFLSRIEYWLVAWSMVSFFSITQSASAQESVAYQTAMASAVRAAANRVLPQIVSVEVIGVAQVAAQRNQGQSEVAFDAPTCGVVVDPEGFIVASDLILRRSSASILVVLPDETRLAAKVVARDHHRGLVILKVNPESPLDAIEFPQSIEAPVGSTVVAVGRYGTDQSPMVSSGILSAKGRLEGTMLQTDARVSPNFYGGLLIDLYGRAIGIVVPAIAEGGAPDDTSWYDSGIAFAVPTTVLKTKLDRLIDGKDIHKGLIGIVPKTKDPYQDGTELAAVRLRSPAEKSGIKAGDEIQSVAGTPVRMFQQIKEALGPYDAGEEIVIELKRDGESKRVTVELAQTIPPLSPQRLGVWAVDEESTVVVKGIVPGSAAENQLKVDDVIQSVNQTEITDVSTLRRTMITAEENKAIKVVVLREQEVTTLTLTPGPISGPVLKETIEPWQDTAIEQAWTVEDLRLPDVKNLAVYTAPPAETVNDGEGVALLVLLLPPDKRDPKAILDSWRDVAARFGVVVCAVCSEDEKRWQPKEIDVISRFATMLNQRVPVAVTALASTGALKDIPASAADSMLVAIALSDRNNFSGIAVSDKTKPPAVRLRENEPDRSLEFLLPIDALENGPTWLAPIAKSGYAIVEGGELEVSTLLKWTRLLQTL